MKNQRFEIVKTKAGFIAYDHDCDELLHDAQGNNHFDLYEEAFALVNDALKSLSELSD